MLKFDHLGIDAHDAAIAAHYLADILGAAAPSTEGADGDMFRLDLDHGGFLLFSTTPAVAATHVAFRVDGDRFAAIVERLRSRGVPFGNDHDDTTNGKTEDPLGGAGRIYFVDDNGHLWEVAC